ncbi:MAG: hypothetical protein ACI80V_000830 [Rhodothermales bacterium]|jgi:hypothetical protein
MPPLTKAILLAALLAGATVSGCGLADGVDAASSFEPVIQVDSLGITIAGIVLDARTGLPPSGPVTLTFAGRGALLVKDVFDREVLSITTEAGAAAFAVANTVLPSPDHPFELRVLAAAEGYEANSTRVLLTARGQHEFRMVLDRVSAPLARRVSADVEVTQVQGTLSMPASAVAEELGVRLLAATIPAGVRIVGIASQDPGEVGFAVSLTSPSKEMLATFPGGMDAGIRLPDGLHQQASQTSGGLVRLRLELENGDAPLGGFFLDGGDMEVTASLSRALLSPRTNELIANGEPVDVYEWNPGDGIWQSLDRVSVVQEGGRLVATFKTPRFGTYSLGYANVPCAPALVRLQGNEFGGSATLYQGDSSQADGVRFWRFRAGQEELTLADPPGFWRGVLRIESGGHIQDIPYNELCGQEMVVDLGGYGAGQPEGAGPHTWTMDPSPCVALRVSALPTLALLSLPQRSVPFTAVETMSERAYLISPLHSLRDAIGRVTKTRSDPGQPDGVAIVVLGGRSWRYEASRNGVLPVSDMAEETGLCVTR